MATWWEMDRVLQDTLAHCVSVRPGWQLQLEGELLFENAEQAAFINHE